MKKRVLIFIAFVMLLSIVVSGCGESRPVVNIYNWGDYIDPQIISMFEKEYGVKAVYDTYATNEDLYIKLKKGGSSYDVVIPSDYMIERMIRENLLAKLDFDNIDQYKNIDDDFLNLDYDPSNEYSVPYMWGTVGIIYNKEMVSRPLTSWADLWDEEFSGQIIMLNSQRDSIAVALKKLHYSMNTRDIKELEEAKNELISQKPLVYAYLGDEVKSVMTGGEAAIAVVWSGDAVIMMQENEDLEYVIPSEGTNLWFDAMVIPENAKNKSGGEDFINFVSRPDIAALNAEYIGYSSPISLAVDLLPEELSNDPVAYPDPSLLINTEIFKDPQDILTEYDRIWTEITSAH